MNFVEIFRTPKKREDIRQIFGCTDREARSIISKAQETECNIVNFQDGRGYYIGTNEEAIRYARQEMSRGLASVKKANAIFARCNVDENQLSLG